MVILTHFLATFESLYGYQVVSGHHKPSHL